MEKLNFEEVNRLIAAIHEMDRDFQFIFQDRLRQEEKIRDLSAEILAGQAKEALRGISVEELKKSKSGIRVAALEEAGYEDLWKLSGAADWELKAIDGIGDKQIASIRGIIAEFVGHLAAYETIQLSAESGGKSVDLIQALSRYRQGELIRKDASGLTDELHNFTVEITSRKIIRSRLKWMFSGKAAKEQTILSVGEILSFMNSPFCERVKRFILLYQNAAGLSKDEALKDFKRYGADHYAILEKLRGEKQAAPFVYGSIPEQLAGAVDAFELKLDQGNFYGNLRAYQKFGTKYILHQKRVLLGDEMGLGKTIQAIAAMAHLNVQEAGLHFLVICPASVLVNWCREIKKFACLETWLIHGKFMEEAFTEWQKKGGVAVTNFESMGKIVERIDNHMRLKMLVIDEAHYIKNPDAQRTENIRRLDNESENILLMTGTPMENRVEEMCSLIDFVRPDLSPEIRGAAHLSKVPQFREMLAPVYLRRTRDQVLKELPPIEEKKEWSAMSDADVQTYIAALKDRDFPGMRRVGFLQEDLSRSSKAKRLLELCEQAKEEGRKVLVYSFFRETAEKVRKFLGSSCVGVINGDTDISARQGMIDRFAGSEEGSVLVCQIQAGGTGLNIQAASIVIFCEPQIKPSLTNQAISRVYRMGQVRNVLVYHLLCEDTVDEAMIHRLEEKQAEFDVFADESVMAEATENLMDREWIRNFIEEENKKYLPMLIG